MNSIRDSPSALPPIETEQENNKQNAFKSANGEVLGKMHLQTHNKYLRGNRNEKKKQMAFFSNEIK